MEKKVFSKALAIVMAVFVCGFTSWAQGDDEWSQNSACPGWNNPASFSAGSTTNYYSAQKGEYSSGTYGKLNVPHNVMNGTTGMGFSSQIYRRSEVGNVTLPSYYDPGEGLEPGKAFRIMSTTTQVPGHPVNRDPNTGDQLPFVPTQFNHFDSIPSVFTTTNLEKSIRVGDLYAGGNATALYYNTYVTTDNAIMIIYYSIVIQYPGHGLSQDPSFIIRVMKQNNAGQWVQASPTRRGLQGHNDTLAYMVASTPSSSGGTVVIGQNGWHQQSSGYDAVYWKEWDKVAINLSNFLYDSVRIEVMVSDCNARGHYGYGYIAGECRQMDIRSSGCPAGMSTDVTTLSAPRGLRDYEWYASDFGVIEPAINFEPGQENDYVTWRSLRAPGTPSPDPNGMQHRVQADDFRVTMRRINGVSVPLTNDSVGNLQTFRCRMTSALDPSKPFDSYLYVKVQNTKPTMEVDTLLLCDGTARLANLSYVPGDPTLVLLDSTKWIFYDNPNCGGDSLAIITGDTATYQFEDRELKGVRVRTYTTDESCYSEAVYPLRPRENPKAGMTITQRVLCDADETTLADTTSGDNNTRQWRFRAADAEDDDMSLTDIRTERVITRGFTHAVEPIELEVRNGLYYLGSSITDTVWCSTTVYDTVAVFLHPDLEVTGDTVVCEGSQTNATVRAIGVDDCEYQWSRTYGEVTGNLPAGDTLRVTPYADKATYFVRVTSPQGCVAWDSIHAYMVRPKLTMLPTDGRVCPGDPAVLTGVDADHYTWTASPADPSLVGQDSNASITVTPEVTTTYTMVGHGSNDCDASPLTATVTIVPLPIPQVSLSPDFVDSENPKMTLRDVSTYGVNSSWLFNDGSTAEGREVTHTFAHSEGLDSVHVTLTSYNDLNCPILYPFAIPVSTFTAWFPNTFTPGSNDANSTFSLFTINDYEYFRINIYNRRGEQVFESNDVNFSWDGTYKGEPCPQGAYVYTCRYRKPGTSTLATLTGSITLIR